MNHCTIAKGVPLDLVGNPKGYDVLEQDIPRAVVKPRRDSTEKKEKSIWRQRNGDNLVTSTVGPRGNLVALCSWQIAQTQSYSFTAAIFGISEKDFFLHI